MIILQGINYRSGYHTADSVCDKKVCNSLLRGGTVIYDDFFFHDGQKYVYFLMSLRYENTSEVHVSDMLFHSHVTTEIY